MAKILIILTVLAITLIAGCSGAVWGNLAVLAVSIWIFIGTLSLGRPAAKPTSASARGRSNTSSQPIENHPDNNNKEPEQRT
jgi:hypothetical protein